MRPARQVVTRSPQRYVGPVHLPWLQAQPIPCESAIERVFCSVAAACFLLDGLYSQPFHLEYKLDGKQRSYTPDFLAVLRHGVKAVVEVKSERFVDVWRDRFDIFADQLACRGYTYYVVTDRHLPKARVEMASLWRRYALHAPEPAKVDLVFDLIDRHGAATFEGLVGAGVPTPVIYHLLIRRRLQSADGLDLGPETRLHRPMELESDDVHLLIDCWFGCSPWRKNVAP